MKMKMEMKDINQMWELLYDFDHTLTLLSHHNAITGTSRSRVDIQDYDYNLNRSKCVLDKVISYFLTSCV